MIEQDDFEYAPFNQFGGIGRAYELFGDRLAEIMEELNARLTSLKFAASSAQNEPPQQELASLAIAGKPRFSCSFGRSDAAKIGLVGKTPISDRYNLTVEFSRSFSLGL